MKKYTGIILLLCCMIFALSCGGGGDNALYSLGGHYGGWLNVTETQSRINHIFSLWGDLEQHGGHVYGTLECPLGLDFDFDFELVGDEVIGKVTSFLGVISFYGTTNGVTISAEITSSAPASGLNIFYDGSLELIKSS